MRLPAIIISAFTIHRPEPKVFLLSEKPPHSKVSIFTDYAEGASEFAERYKSILQGVKISTEFATIMQQKAKFWINMDTGKPESDYVKKVSATIRGLGVFLGRCEI